MTSRHSARWLVSPRYDALFFLGSALLVVPMVWLYRGLEGRILPLGSDNVLAAYFVFAALFDHPHIFQSFSRTLADPIERARHRYLHTVGLLAFIAGGFVISAVGLDRQFIVVAAMYGTWHIARQHWGFLRVYKALNKDYGPLQDRLDWLLFYGGTVALWLMGYTDVGNKITVYRALTAPFPDIPLWLANTAMRLFVVVLAVYIGHQIFRRAEGKPLNLPKLLLLGCALGTHAYVYVGTNFPFLVAEAVQTIFHDVQYQGFIMHFQRRRLSDVLAKRFLVASVIYGLVAATIECLALLQRDLKWIAIPFGMIVIYHYYADGRIWRFREAPELHELFPKAN